MTKSILRWGLIGLLICLAPFIFVEVQGYISIHAAFPALNAISAKSKMALVIFTTFNLLCAILTAITTALPCGYLAKNQSKVVAILIIISIQSIPVYLFFQEPKVGTFVTVVWLGQFVSVVISAFAFAEIGRRMAAKS